MNSESKEERARGEGLREKGRKDRVFWAECMPEMMAACCQGRAWRGSVFSPRTMAGRRGPMMRVCLWVAIIPVVLLGAAFLLGCYLSADTVRVLWLIVSGTVAVTAALCLLLAVAMCGARAPR